MLLFIAASAKARLASANSRRGAKAMWIASGTIGGFRHGEVVEGQAMMVDAVSQINYYHGDFGRTWCVGEPSRELQERIRRYRSINRLAIELA